MQFRTLLCVAIALLGLQPLVAQAGPCDAHFTFDGNLADASGNGYDGIATGPATTSEKTAARLPYIMSFEQGRSGQALKLDGTTAVRVPLDLSIEGCPQITITAWVKFDDNPTKGSQYILSSGPGGPGLVRDGTNLSVYGGEKRYRQSKALRGGSWEFIAASLDYEAGKMTVHWRNRVSEIDIKAKGTKQADVWIGAYDDNARMAVQSGLIDDLRVTAGILTADQISQLRARGGATPAGADRGPLGDGLGPVGLPGDQYDPRALPGDQYDPAQLPGDQYDPRALPGDQYDPAQLPGDQYEPAQLPGDQYDPQALPGDQYESGDSPPPTTGQIYEPGQPAPSVLESESGASSVFPGDRDISSQTVQGMQEAGGGSTPLDITYDSEEEGEAAAAAAEEQRQQESPAQSQLAERTGEIYPVGEPRESALAGFEGDIRKRIDLADHFIHKITWDQRNDRPCMIVIGGEASSWDRADFNCDAMVGLTLPLPNFYEPLDREVRLEADNAAIGRIQVCSSALNRRLKGISIWGEQINPDGTTTYREETDSEQFPNCARPSPSVLCPANTLATGLVVHANDLGGDDRAEIVGLRLICRGIGVR